MDFPKTSSPVRQNVKLSSSNISSITTPSEFIQERNRPVVSMGQERHEESSIEGTRLATPDAEDYQITFEVIKEGTKRTKEKLTDSRGYSYNVKRRRKNNEITDWQCTIRPKENPCRATVIQKRTEYILGKQPHNHAAQPGVVVVAKVTSTMKTKAQENLFKPASVQNQVRQITEESI